MAVVQNQNQDDQNQQLKGQNSLNPLQTVGTAAPAGAPAGGTPMARQQASNLAQQQQSGSGRFTNLQKYLQANQGGSQRIAQNIENQYNKQAQDVRQGIEQAQGTLNRQVNPLQQTLGNQGSQQLSQGFQDPNAVLADQARLNSFRNLAGGLGQNISNVAGTQNLQQQALQGQLGQLQNTANLAGNEQGRYQLLRNAVNAPGYSQGAQRLDQTLLQSQPNVTNNLQAGLQNIAGQTNQQLSNLSTDTLSKINALRGLSQNRQDQWNNLLNLGTDSVAGINSPINELGLSDVQAISNQRMADAANQINVVNPQLQQALKNAQLNQDQLAQIQQGITASDIDAPQLRDRLYGIDASQFFKPNTDVAANTTNTIDKATYDRYNAIRALSGQDKLGGNIFGGPATDIGTFKANSFDNNAYQQAIAQAKNKYELENVANLVQAIYPSFDKKAWMNSTIGRLPGGLPGQGFTGDPLSNAAITNIQTHLPGGGGMAANDPNARYRESMARAIDQLLQPDKSGSSSLSYENLVKAINDTWAPVFGADLVNNPGRINPQALSPSVNPDTLRAISDYGRTLGQMRGNTLGGQVNDKGNVTVPKGIMTKLGQ